MCGGKKKQKTEEKRSLSDESRRNITQGQNNIRGIMGANPFEAYTGDYVAGMNDTQLGARSMFADGMGAGNALIGQAADAARAAGGYAPEQITAQSFTDANIGDYMNPYQEQVIDANTRDINQNRDLSLNDNKARAAQAGAFGGSRHGVIDAQTYSAANDSVGRMSAGLRSQGYNTAAQLWGQDADRQTQADMANNQFGMQSAGLGLQTAGLLGQFGQYQNDSARADASLMGQFGSEEQANENAGLAAQYADFLRGEEDPYRRAQVEAMATGLMPALVNSTGTSTQTQTPGAGQIIGTGLQVASMFSDERLKTDIKPVGTHKGRKWYEFRYLWDNATVRRYGLMAQDLLKTEPERVHVTPSGFYTVDYEGVL